MTDTNNWGTHEEMPDDEQRRKHRHWYGLAEVTSTAARVIEIIGKFNRWGIDSTERRHGHPLYGKTNRVILIDLFGQLKREIAEVEKSLADEMIGIRIADVSQVETLMRQYADQFGAQEVVKIMRIYDVTDVSELLTPAKLEAVTEELRMKLGSKINAAYAAAVSELSSGRDEGGEHAWKSFRVGDREARRGIVLVEHMNRVDFQSFLSGARQILGQATLVMLRDRVRSTYPSAGNTIDAMMRNHDKQGIESFVREVRREAWEAQQRANQPL